MKTGPTPETLHLHFDEQHQLVGGMPPVPCALCGASAVSHALSTLMLKGETCWVCPCGARGVRVMLADLDEVYEEVLEAWGLEPCSPGLPPPEPVGDSGMLFASYVDGMGLRTRLFDEARRQGAQVATSEVVVRIRTPPRTFPDWTWDVLWARRGSWDGRSLPKI
ncbi:hypothetical protein ACQKGO_35580 [Corallococcus interemptor]|uniref:hypothetical protein n=1 Tax=Corallococcus interemptor TaxID=2316720 RepID=UPI003D06F0ED